MILSNNLMVHNFLNAFWSRRDNYMCVKSTKIETFRENIWLCKDL